MTDTYTPEDRLNDLCSDVLVAAHLARARKLRPDYADALAMRVRSASTDMIEPGDAQLLRSAANALSHISMRIKSADVRVKAAPVPQPDIAAMIRELDAERLSGGSASSRNEDVERARIAEANRQLAERNRSIEEQRRR